MTKYFPGDGNGGPPPHMMRPGPHSQHMRNGGPGGQMGGPGGQMGGPGGPSPNYNGGPGGPAPNYPGNMPNQMNQQVMKYLFEEELDNNVLYLFRCQ